MGIKVTFFYVYLSSTSVSFGHKMVQMPNLALVETKRITMHVETNETRHLYSILLVFYYFCRTLGQRYMRRDFASGWVSVVGDWC